MGLAKRALEMPKYSKDRKLIEGYLEEKRKRKEKNENNSSKKS